MIRAARHITKSTRRQPAATGGGWWLAVVAAAVWLGLYFSGVDLWSAVDWPPVFPAGPAAPDPRIVDTLGLTPLVAAALEATPALGGIARPSARDAATLAELYAALAEMIDRKPERLATGQQVAELAAAAQDFAIGTGTVRQKYPRLWDVLAEAGQKNLPRGGDLDAAGRGQAVALFRSLSAALAAYR